MISNEHRIISRRSALRGLAAGTGAAATALWLDRLTLLAQDPAMHTHLAAAASAQAAAAPFTPKALSAAQLESVATLAELIIPTTDTPGAKAALVDRFIDNVMANAQPADKERFLTGLAWMDTRSTALYGKAFTAATPAQQTELLTKLAAPSGHAAEDAPGVPFFNAMKGMTISGYYSTKIGLEQELGDNGQLFNPTFVGCTHPEHQI
jgi:gluconate 2-dehydrogenase gamma chain